jgi:glycosyltransferase involved in cell wall biosynthesis
VKDTVNGYSRYLRVRSSGLSKQHAPWNTKHLLILSWLFPPTVSGGVYRPLSFARRAAELGWQVTVVAGPEPDTPSPAGSYLLRRLPSSVRLLRIAESTLKPSYRLFPRIDGGFGNVIETLEQTLAFEMSPPSVIFASGPPFHNFVVGWHLSRRLGVPLALDYRDEWTQCPFEFVRRGNVDLHWERKCLAHAARVVFTTRSFIDHAHKLFPEVDARKFVHIPNGFDRDDLGHFDPDDPGQFRAPVSEGDDEGLIRLSFLGALGPHTPADGLLATIRQMLEKYPAWRNRLRIRFVGQRHRGADRLTNESFFEEIVSFSDQVSKPEAIQIMRESSALIALNPASLNRYIPGKLFDYIASGRPILVYGEGGEIASLVRELDAGMVLAEGDFDQLHEALARLAGRPPSTNKNARTEWLQRHERSNLADRLLEQLENLNAQ